MTWLKRLLFLSIFGLLGGSLLMGELLSRPSRHEIGSPPPELGLKPVSFNCPETGRLSAWLGQGTKGRGIILLLHGVHADRRQMLARAKFLLQEGFSVFLMDLQAHGESEGERISFGLREGKGVDAALSYLEKEFPAEPLGAIGVSLGGASLLFSEHINDLRAVVLESVYSSIRLAGENRMENYLGSPGRMLTPLLLWQLPIRLGISIEDLSPLKQVSKLHIPVFILSGSTDKNTTEAETRTLFEAASEPKKLWIVEGAAHVDLSNFVGAEYEKTVLQFLNQNLSRQNLSGQNLSRP